MYTVSSSYKRKSRRNARQEGTVICIDGADSAGANVHIAVALHNGNISAVLAERLSYVLRLLNGQVQRNVRRQVLHKG